MKLGILGGTFDPIHLGHLVMGELALDQLALDLLWVVPASRPPHKPQDPMSEYSARCAMARLAFAGRADIEVSEIERPGAQPSFTVDTLQQLRVAHPRFDEVWLILGEDSLYDIPSWKSPREILGLARLAALPRPGAEPDLTRPPHHRSGTGDSFDERRQLLDRVLAEVTWLDGPRLQISATQIRARVREGRSIRYLVPEPVRAFITEHRLYAAESS